MAKEVTFELKGFNLLLGRLADEYHIAPSDVCLLLQEHSVECSNYFSLGEQHGQSFASRIDNEIVNLEKNLNEESSKTDENP